MPYCPTCKESVAEGNKCPECGSKLVDELPFQAVPADGTTWVEIASFGTEDEANLLKGFLEKQLEREAAAHQVADNYLHFVQVYEGQVVH